MTCIKSKIFKFVFPAIAAIAIMASGFNVLATSGNHGREHKVNICHRTGSQYHPFEAINIDESAFDGEGKNDHTQHGDFLYHGPIDKNGHPTKEGNSWCGGPSPSPAPSPTPSPSPEPSTEPSPTPNPSPGPEGGQGQNQGQDQEVNVNVDVNQTQENNQTVNVTGQVAGVSTVPVKQPETGVGVLGMVSVAGVGPLGLLLARYGRGRIVGKKEEDLTSIASDIIKDRLDKKSA